MKRVIQREVTTIQITSIEVYWDDDTETGTSTNPVIDIVPADTPSRNAAPTRRKKPEEKP